MTTEGGELKGGVQAEQIGPKLDSIHAAIEEKGKG